MVFDVISVFMENSWNMFGLEYPGLGISVGAVFLGVFFAIISIRFLGSILGFTMSENSNSISGFVQRGGNNKNIKISEKRKGDKF